MDKYNIRQQLSQDISNIYNILQSFRDDYWLNHDHLHKYMDLLNTYISANGKDIAIFDKEIKYIFANIKEIAKDNIYINDLLYSYSYFDFFVSESFLNYLDGLTISEIDHILLVRLINKYFREYDRSIVLSNHKDFFKKIIEYIYKLPAVQNLSDNYNFIFTFQNLVWRLDYSLSEYYQIFFVLFEKWIVSGYGLTREAGIINNIDEDEFINILNKQDLLTKIRIIEHLHRDIDFKSLHNLSNFDKNILFYLSLLDSTKYFESSDDKAFLEFCEDFYNMDLWSKLKSTNDIQDIDKMVKFLNIYMFDKFFDERFWRFFLTRIFEGNKYRYYIDEFFKKYQEVLSQNISIIYPIFMNIYQESTQKENIHKIVIDIIWHYCANHKPYYIVSNYRKIFTFLNQWIVSRMSLEKIYANLFINLDIVNNHSYQEWNSYIKSLFTELNKLDIKIPITNKYDIYKYIKKQSNNKVMYLINRNKIYMKNRSYGNDQYKNMEWWIWRNGRAIIRFYHWTMFVLDK